MPIRKGGMRSRPDKGARRDVVPMNTTPPVPDTLPPLARGNRPVLSYASRGARGGFSWTMYNAVCAAVVAAAAASFLFVWWRQSGNVSDRTEARGTTLVTTVQCLRAQVALFKRQHNNRLPGVSPLIETGGPTHANEATFWAQMTQYTDADGDPSPFKGTRHCYGPYLNAVAANRLNGSSTVASAPACGVGFVYDFVGGAGTGKLWGVEESGALCHQ